jgi:ABC-type amino acid transport substrate-binding protein
MRRVLVGACVLALGIASLTVGARGATLAEVKKGRGLHICANPEALPFSSDDPARPGVQLELARKIADALGVKIEVSWVYAPRAARQAGCEVFMSAAVVPGGSPTSRTPMQLTKPYSGTGYVLLVPRSMNGVKRFEDLQGQKIGVLVHSAAQWELTKRGLVTSPTLTQEEVFELMLTGEALAGVLPAPYAGWYLKEHPAAPIKIAEEYALEQELRWNLAVGLRNSDQALVDAVSQILERLERDGTIQATFSRYGVPYYPPFPTP